MEQAENLQDEMLFQSAPLREGRPVTPSSARSAFCSFNPRPCARGDNQSAKGLNATGVSIRAPARGATNQHLLHGRARHGFNPRPCARGDRRSRRSFPMYSCFNPRPCARGDRRIARNLWHPHAVVSIRAPARGATCIFLTAGRDGFVSIRAPARGATRQPECDVNAVHLVSIRAPARGATVGEHASRRATRGHVSIRAPARGATASARCMGARRDGFNPRPCARGDQGLPVASGSHEAVSIRAPARGATGVTDHSTFGFVGFNPRPCARGDSSESGQHCNAPRSFNPRPCARGDQATVTARTMGPVYVSIRAPARGATDHVRFSRRWNDWAFQSAPLREGRPSRTA